MSDPAFTSLSCHLRCADRDGVLRALRDLDGVGSPLAVWPPRRLPPGVLVSPERYGWISLWGTTAPCGELLIDVARELECSLVLIERVEDERWVMEVIRDDRRVARFGAPADSLDALVAYERAWAELEARGEDPTDGMRLEEVARPIFEKMESQDGGSEDLESVRVLEELLPPGARLEEALRLLRGEDDDRGETVFLEDWLETFANYLGIRDAGWDARHDAETLAAGDYEDTEGLPDRWEEFVVAPARRLTVLTE